MNYRKLSISLLIIFLAILLVYFSWETPYILIPSLLVLAIIKNRLVPIKKELTMFIVGGIIGTSAESLVMFGGPWSYAAPELINFPIWLPFLWGLAGVTGITLHQSISESL